MRLPVRAELSDQQEDFLMEAPLDSPVVCVGPPGTGKTVLALYRSHTLNKSKIDVDFIMYSKLLNRYVQRSVEELSLQLNSRTWHSWIAKLWAQGNGRFRMPQIEQWKPDFKKAIGLITEEKCARLSKMYWSHLIVDEGQDFPKEFYLFLTIIRNDESVLMGRSAPGLTIFADENQRMDESRNSTINEILANVPGATQYKVNINYRNSGPIAKLASYFYVGLSTGIPKIAKNTKGAIPRLRRFEIIDDEAKSIINWLSNNDDLSVGVIVPDKITQNRIVASLKPLAEKREIKIQKYVGGTDPALIDFYTGGTITVVCDASCKGLEFDGVFIPQLHMHKTDGANEDFFKMKMYVMISRARSYLQLSFSECDESPAVLKMLPPEEEGVLEWEI